MQGFILGAGLGTRLRPLTDHLPKPLVPLFHKPLAAWTVAACRSAGVERFAINTHHLPEKWQDFDLRPEFGRAECAWFHEPVLLDTGGGIRNLRHWLRDEPLLVHNGDIFSTLPLETLMAAHLESGLPATLALRTAGAERRVALDAGSGRVIDVRHELGVSPGTHVFSGIYCVNPEFVAALPAGRVVSVIPAFLEFARAGRLGGVVLDEGVWLDLGDRESYLEAHRRLDLAPRVHPEARVDGAADIGRCVIGPGAHIAGGAVLRDSVVWEGSQVGDRAVLDRCVVTGGEVSGGVHADRDL